MEIELVQLECKDGDKAYNLNKTFDAIINCSELTDILVFPETYLSGFPTKKK